MTRPLLLAILGVALSGGALLHQATQAYLPELSAHTSPLRYADMETLHWNADGISLSLQYTPYPQQSLMLFRNGIVQQGNTDFTTKSNFIYPRDPQPDDVYVAWYRY